MIVIARGAAYYDASYKRIIEVANPVVWDMMHERCIQIVPHVTAGSILDVGCGLGLMADYFAQQYTGVDFSPVAIEYAQNQYSTAEFIEADVYQFLLTTKRRFDTVILSEI